MDKISFVEKMDLILEYVGMGEILHILRTVGYPDDLSECIQLIAVFWWGAVAEDIKLDKAAGNVTK